MAGAGGINAARAVLSAPADGYTLALFSNGTRDFRVAVQEPDVQSGDRFRSGVEHGLFRLHLRDASRFAISDAG